ncbi:MAG: hypothetical protein HY693_00945 [Deltaproteobacteria bacterium]|nr:hypothetical protein [Deltaproteobacteria bacterium]
MYKRYNKLLLLLIIGFLPFFIIGGCDDDNGGGGGACPETNVSIAVCDPDAGPFSLVIDNGFFPAVVGSQSVLEDEEGVVRLEITALDEIEAVAGIQTRVLEEREFEDDLLIEVSRNFFAQAEDGTVCYFGEEVDICDDGLEPVGDKFLCNGEEPSHEGAWRAGEDDNLPGIIMLAEPEVGLVYNEEVAPGIAEDIAEVTDLGEPIEVLDEIFFDTLTTLDCSPLDPGARDTKVYIRDMGIARDEDLFLVEFVP